MSTIILYSLPQALDLASLDQRTAYDIFSEDGGITPSLKAKGFNC